MKSLRKKLSALAVITTLSASMVVTSLPVSAVSDDHVCMVTETEMNDLLNAEADSPSEVLRTASFKAGNGYNSNIYKIGGIRYLYNYVDGNSDVLLPEDADAVAYYTETDGQWCTYGRNSLTWGDNAVRIITSFDRGYLTIHQLLEKTEEIMAEVDEEILDYEYFYSNDLFMSLIYFKTNSGEHLVPYHNKVWKDEYKGMAESGKIYPAKELSDFLRRPVAETVAGVKDNTVQTSFVNPDGTVSIVDGEIDYDSMEFVDGYVILGDADRNGKLDVRDSSFIAKTLSGKSKTTLPDNADYNKDGKKDIRDAADISRNLAKK